MQFGLLEVALPPGLNVPDKQMSQAEPPKPGAQTAGGARSKVRPFAYVSAYIQALLTLPATHRKPAHGRRPARPTIRVPAPHTHARSRLAGRCRAPRWWCLLGRLRRPSWGWWRCREGARRSCRRGKACRWARRNLGRTPLRYEGVHMTFGEGGQRGHERASKECRGGRRNGHAASTKGRTTKALLTAAPARPALRPRRQNSRQWCGLASAGAASSPSQVAREEYTEPRRGAKPGVELQATQTSLAPPFKSE